MLPSGAHPETSLLRQSSENGVPIYLPRVTYEEERDTAIRYGTYASVRKEAEFIHAELAKQVQAGHVAVVLLEAVLDLHKLWLYPMAVIPQFGRRPRLILIFTWGGLNEETNVLSPMEAMRFGGALCRIL